MSILFRGKFSKVSQCSPLLLKCNSIFIQGGTSLKVLLMQPIATHSYMVISVRGWVIPQNPPVADHWSPTYDGSLSQERGRNSSEVLLMQPIAAHPYVAILVRRGNSSKALPLQLTLTWHFWSGVLIPQKSSLCGHCSPLLNVNFIQGVNSQKSFQCSPLLLKFNSIFIQGGTSLKVLLMQPIATHSYMVISVRAWVIPQNPPVADHWSPNYDGSLSQERGRNSSEVLLMQPIAAHPYVAILVRRGNSSKALPMQLTLTWNF